MITKTALSKWQKSKITPSTIQTVTDRIGLWRLSRLFADHIPDHNALWGTRKQCGKERQRATLPE